MNSINNSTVSNFDESQTVPANSATTTARASSNSDQRIKPLVVNYLKLMTELNEYDSRIWVWASTKKDLVNKINTGLDEIKAIVKNTELMNGLDKKTKNVFLGLILQFCERVKKTNDANESGLFASASITGVQLALKKAGGSLEYFQLFSFLQQTSAIAFAHNKDAMVFVNMNLEDTDISTPKQNGILVCVGNKWTLTDPAYKPNQTPVEEKLRNMVASIKNDSNQELLNRFSTEELVLAQALLAQLLTNYFVHCDNAPDLSGTVFDLLGEMEGLISNSLRSRRDFSFASRAAVEALKELVGINKEVLIDERFQGLFSDSNLIKKMQGFDRLVRQFKHFHIDPERLLTDKNDKLVAVASKDGVNLYATGALGDENRELVVFISGNDDFWQKKTYSTFSFQGARSSHFDLDGQIHSQAEGNAIAKEKTLKSLLGALADISFKTINFAGFGLDGASATLVGWKYKIENPEVHINILACGTPTFLDQEADGKFLTQINELEGFNLLHYAMEGDPNLSNMGVTGAVGLSYRNNSAVKIPVPQGTLYTTEQLTNDTRKAYMGKLLTANKMIGTMQSVFNGLDNLEQRLSGIPASKSTVIVEEVTSTNSNGSGSIQDTPST